MSMSHTTDCGQTTETTQVPPKRLTGTAQRCRAVSRMAGDAPARARLRQAMADVRWTSADIAAAWGIDRTAVDDVLNGKTPLHAGDLECLGALFNRYCELRIAEHGARQSAVMVAAMKVIATNSEVNTEIAHALENDGDIDDREALSVRRAMVHNHEAERELIATLSKGGK